jgi:hypothetical protein
MGARIIFYFNKICTLIRKRADREKRIIFVFFVILRHENVNEKKSRDTFSLKLFSVIRTTYANEG